MSFSTTSPHHSYPATTTTTTNTQTTTTTTTVTGSQTTSATPTIGSRAVGWHAKQFKLEWGNRTDQHKYLSITGLPAVHAAVINNDWDFAIEALCPDDIGLPWIPPASQRTAKTNSPYLTSADWAAKLPSLDPEKQREAIVQMATDRGSKTTVNGAGSLYGSNLLTLCLQLPAPADFMQKLIKLTTDLAPQYLNLPDANGCTPLYIAAQRGDAEQAASLLAAGADPQLPCVFRSSRDDGDELPVISPYIEALNRDDSTVFELFLEKILASSGWENDYPASEDPLGLAHWVSQREEADVRTLSQKFKFVKNAMHNFDDKSGTSIVYRCLTNHAQLDEDVTPLYQGCKEYAEIFAAAVSGNADNFFNELNSLLSQTETSFIATQLIYVFIDHNSPSDIKRLGEACPNVTNNIVEFMQYVDITKNISLEKFSAFIEMAWPLIKEKHSGYFEVLTTRADDRHIIPLISLPNFTVNSFSASIMMDRASLTRNTAAFDFAAAHSFTLKRLLSRVEADKDFQNKKSLRAAVKNTLEAGSLIWFQKFLQAGINLQKLLDSDDEILPLMADLSPNLLTTWLQDLQFSITEQTIDMALTDEGRAVLATLMEAQNISRPADL